jgi:glycolate oxidase
MVKEIQKISKKHGVTIAVFGHAGEGNLHPNILTDRRNAELMVRTDAAIAEIFQSALSFGGTISGEHGIGTAKTPFLAVAVQEKALHMMKEIKSLFDPEGILNPGKIFS